MRSGVQFPASPTFQGSIPCTTNFLRFAIFKHLIRTIQVVTIAALMIEPSFIASTVVHHVFVGPG